MNIEAYRGDSLTIDGVVRNQDGDVVNITGGTILFSVKKNQTDTDYVITKSASITSPTEGKFTIILSPSDLNKTPGTYFYDIELRLNEATIHTISKGFFTILTDITR